MYQQDGDDNTFKPGFSDVFNLMQRIKHQQKILENIECKAEIHQAPDKRNNRRFQVATVIDDNGRNSNQRNDKTKNMHNVNHHLLTINNMQIQFGFYLFPDIIGHSRRLLIDFDKVLNVA